MRRIGIAVTITALVFASAAVVAHADSVYGYTAPGTWFSPGQGAGSPYDSICAKWVENNFSKGSGSWGLVTFIGPGGGWSNTRQGYGWLVTSPSDIWATKKMHCKNNSSVTYQGGCYGFMRYFSCA